MTAVLPPPRPQINGRHPTAPTILSVNGHFASVGEVGTQEQYQHGIQIIDQDKSFNSNISKYLSLENVSSAGFNYHPISVFGSQSTGKSTLLNYLFGTDFGVMAAENRAQTTKGIWMSKNKQKGSDMAENILVMDVEGTDGRERGEDQDFERKSALFALATSEVLIINMWENQVGLYQGANMGLLKTVFEVNLELFLKDHKSSMRSLLFFVIRDYIGRTPLSNLRSTLLQDLNRIWSSLSKPEGMTECKLEDYFDVAFAALPHKLLQEEKFVDEVKKLGTRFKEGRRDPKLDQFRTSNELQGGVFLPEYHRRIPADGFAVYAEGVWDQIVNNKDLDLPTQQELLAQFRCDEIAREALIIFDEAISPLESQQAAAIAAGNPQIISRLGTVMRETRMKTVKAFETEASRYHKGVYQRKRAELEDKIDTRLKQLFTEQLAAAHKLGIKQFTDAVSEAVKVGQKAGAAYDFAEIVHQQRAIALEKFEKEAKSSAVQEAPWSDYQKQKNLYQQELEQVSSRLRKDEMRRLATRVERWVGTRLGDAIGVEFNALGSGRGGSGAPETGKKPAEKSIWDRVWSIFRETVQGAEKRFTDRAKSFDASLEEVEVGLWRLRRKSWGVLRAKINEEMMEGNLLLKLRENFEDKFRYDDHGVPRIWRPTDDIEGAYSKARESTLVLIPLLSKFKLSETSSEPQLAKWIGNPPTSITPADEEDLTPIGGVDDEEGKTLEEEMTILGEAKRQELMVRFKKTADGVYVEAKRSAIGGMTQVPLYFWALLLALGWNELWAVLRNPLYFLMIAIILAGVYVTYTLNLWTPIIQMSTAASRPAIEEGKRRLRSFLESSDTGRQATAMPAANGYEMDSLDSRGKKHVQPTENDDDDDI